VDSASRLKAKQVRRSGGLDAPGHEHRLRLGPERPELLLSMDRPTFPRVRASQAFTGELWRLSCRTG